MTRSQQVIKEAKERDGNQCQKCGYKGSSKSRVKGHHIIPLAFDGPDEVNNVATLCNHCHRYAPEDFLKPTEYESVFQDYIRTDVRPEIDFAYFGGLAIEKLTTAYQDGLEEATDEELEPDELLNGIQTIVNAIRELPDATEFTDPDYYWILLAGFAEYGCVPEADPLTQEYLKNE